MRGQMGIALFAAACVGAAACGELGSSTESTTGQAITAAPSVRISEIHYDNTGTDVGEAIEISGPAGTDVTGWQVVLYNGSGGASYNTQTLSGAIPATCGARGVLVLNYPTNGVQNGGGTATGTDSPDAIALVDAAGVVVELLSYEGTFTPTNGPALGIASVDIGVRELGTEPVGQSLQRTAAAWTGPIAATFGACNDTDDQPAPDVVIVTVAPVTATVAQGATIAFAPTAFDAANQPIPGISFTWTSSATGIASVTTTGVATGVAVGDAVITASAPNGVVGTAALHVTAATPPTGSAIHVSEIHYDNAGVDVGEAIELEGPAGSDVTGWSIVLYDGNGGAAYSTTPLSGALVEACDGRGVLVVSYPSNGIQNGSPDGVALVDASGQVVELLSYEGVLTATTGPAAGMTTVDIIASEASSSPVGQSLQRDTLGRWALVDATFGACNATGTPQPGNSISFSGRVASDPALPVGFQAQIFATEHDANDGTVVTTIAWTTETPSVASVDANGVITALAAGTATFRATAEDGTTATLALPMRIGVATTTAHYDGNTEFGEPTDADTSDDFIVRHAEYTASYNPNRGTPNWVSYDIDASAFGTEDRCNCFTHDPALPASFTRLTTADYTGAGAFAGYGIDRGHMTRSFDRTTASLDNATTFYLSNVVPQAADVNQGPWSVLETVLGDLARFSDKEVYVIAGVAGSKGTLKNEGKIVIPASTWKVAVIVPRDHGLAGLVDYRDLQVIAVNMPNEPGVRNVPWQTYATTVDAIEAVTGYDLLAALPDRIERAVEAGIQPPLAAIDGPYAGLEGAAVAMSAAGSIDPNGSVVQYAWDFGDGTRATGQVVSHTYARYGVYAVSLTATDNDGLTDVQVTTAVVANAAPVVGAFGGATLLPRERYEAAGTFTDPGAGPWTASVDYGDGSGVAALALTGTGFALSHAYATTGVFAVTVRVSDGNATASATQTVTVQSLATGVRSAAALVDQLVAAGKLRRLDALVLDLGLGAALLAIELGRPALAVIPLRAVVAEIDLLVRLRRLAEADAAPLRTLVNRAIRAATP